MTASDKTGPPVRLAEALPEELLGEAALELLLSGWIDPGVMGGPGAVVSVDGQACGRIISDRTLPARMLQSQSADCDPEYGFTGRVRIPTASTGSTQEVCLNLEHSAEPVVLGRVKRVGLPGPEVEGVTVAICMAVYNPDIESFRRQVGSIAGQDFSNWICIVNDDGSDADIVSAMRQELAKDDRFFFYRNPSNKGFYRNFEIAISRVPESVSYIALADQDDRWNSNKLRVLLERIRQGYELVYSDLRIVDETGGVIAPSYWGFRINAWQDLHLMLIANTVTGAACMFDRSLLKSLLPFPPRIGDAFHDHWLACAALASGRIGYVEEPLYDYYQHDNAVIGHCGFGDDVTDNAIPLRSLFNPLNWKSLAGRLLGSSTAVYWFECRRIESICNNLSLRLGKPAPAFSLFAGGLSSAWRLFWFFLGNRQSKRKTNRAELRLARGYLVHSLRSRLLNKGPLGRR